MPRDIQQTVTIITIISNLVLSATIEVRRIAAGVFMAVFQPDLLYLEQRIYFEEV